MDFLVQDNLHFSEELQWFRDGHGSLQIIDETVRSESNRPRVRETKKCSPGSKSTTFARGIVQLFNLQKIGMNPVEDPSVLPTQSPIYL